MKKYPYKEGFKKGFKDFEEWLRKTNLFSVGNEKEVRRVASEIISYPEEVKEWHPGEMEDYFEGFSEGCLVVWRKAIGEDVKITIEDIP